MRKLHPSDRAVEPDPPVRVWDGRLQPHLHLRGPRTQVTGNQGRGGDAVTLARFLSSARLRFRLFPPLPFPQSALASSSPWN